MSQLRKQPYEVLEWHDSLRQQEVMPITPYNPRNNDESLDIEYRFEDRLTNTSKISPQAVRLVETYDHRTEVELTVGTFVSNVESSVR